MSWRTPVGDVGARGASASATVPIRRKNGAKRLTPYRAGYRASVRRLADRRAGRLLWPRFDEASQQTAPFSSTPMQPPPAGDVTVLLREWGAGDRAALDRLVPLLYEHLRDLAHNRLRAEHGLPSVNTTGLVHEAYIRLVDVRTARFRDRAHFLAMASRVMRRILVDHARTRLAARRGSGAVRVEMREDLLVSEAQADALTDLDEALGRLEAVDERQARILEQRYFGGLSLEETAEAIGVSLATVKRELRFARAWLATELGRPDPER